MRVRIMEKENARGLSNAVALRKALSRTNP